MKTNLIYSQNNNNKVPTLKHKLRTDINKTKITRENEELNRPARAISFGGSAGLMKGATKAFNSTVEFVNKNEVAYNAIYSIIVAGLLKPLFVLNMPGSEDKDKQIVATKNFLQAFLGGFLSLTIGGGFIKKAMDIVKNNLKLIKGVEEVDGKDAIKVVSPESEKALELAKDVLKKEKGSFGYKFKYAKQATEGLSGLEKIKGFFKSYKNADTSSTIDEISKKAKWLVDNFNKNHKSTFEKNKTFVKELKEMKELTDEIKSSKKIKTTYEDAFETLWKNSTGALTSIGKAKISTILLPGVLAFLFAKKNLEKEQKLQQQSQTQNDTLSKNSSFKQEQEQFQKMLNKNNSVQFKGNILNSAIDGSATIIEKAGMSKVGVGLAKILAKFKKPTARMADFESVAITTYWVQNTARSKKIEESQKLGLNVHSILVTVVSSATAFLLDWALDGLIDKSKEKYTKNLEKIIENIKNDSKHKNAFKDIASLKFESPSDAIHMGIKDSVSKLLKNDYTSDDVNALIKKLSETETFKNAPKDFNLKDAVNQAIEKMKQTEPIKNDIKEACKNMIGSKDIIDKLSDIDTLADNKTTTDAIEKLAKKYGKKLSKFKSLTIFTLVVRFLVPVLMVPFSGKLKKKIVAWQEEKKNNTAKA